MLNNVIKIRDKPCFAHREDPERVAKTVIVSLQLPVRRSEDGEIQMAKKTPRQTRGSGLPAESIFLRAAGDNRESNRCCTGRVCLNGGNCYLQLKIMLYDSAVIGTVFPSGDKQELSQMMSIPASRIRERISLG